MHVSWAWLQARRNVFLSADDSKVSPRSDGAGSGSDQGGPGFELEQKCRDESETEVMSWRTNKAGSYEFTFYAVA